MIDHRHPLTLALVLDWYSAVLDGEPTAGLPHLASSSWHHRGHDQTPGFAPSQWSACSNCNDGLVRKGVCPKCKGKGGWYRDPYDNAKSIIATVANDKTRGLDRHELGMTLTLADFPEELLAEPMPGRPIEAMLIDLHPTAPPTLRRTEAALIWMRPMFPHQRGALVAYHLLHLPVDPELYDDGLLILGETLGPRFRAPAAIRAAAAARAKVAA